MKKRKYVAYGSNLNVEQMKRRCPDAKILSAGYIENHRLAFTCAGGSGSYLTIEDFKGGVVPVVIWTVSAQDERNLDRYEGFPTFYRKENITVMLPDGSSDSECFVYIMNALSYGIPTMQYINTCIGGYQHFGFDARYIEQAFDLSVKTLRKR